METLSSVTESVGFHKPISAILAGQRQAARHVRLSLGTYARYDHCRTLLVLRSATPEMLRWVITADTEELRATGYFLEDSAHSFPVFIGGK